MKPAERPRFSLALPAGLGERHLGKPEVPNKSGLMKLLQRLNQAICISRRRAGKQGRGWVYSSGVPVWNCLLPLLTVSSTQTYLPEALISRGREGPGKAISDSCPNSRCDSGLGEASAAQRSLHPNAQGKQLERCTWRVSGRAWPCIPCLWEPEGGGSKHPWPVWVRGSCLTPGDKKSLKTAREPQKFGPRERRSSCPRRGVSWVGMC